ncbi:MAG TPA: hypothetical protein VHV10_02875 [Ktedonobacteraceae bacterium]|jgi:hypothetical protein|nr:hypothetical protein [Ktedonobacteraceae bacterium]
MAGYYIANSWSCGWLWLQQATFILMFACTAGMFLSQFFSMHKLLKKKSYIDDHIRRLDDITDRALKNDISEDELNRLLQELRADRERMMAVQ